uniref:DUF1003 domain-containing protein n=1 Tax=Cyanothece sp. (strain PCC 7425 / ATCC 29141) TaxID=395961 RepID=B8HKX8_CYAP4
MKLPQASSRIVCTNVDPSKTEATATLKDSTTESSGKKPLTFGQKLADKMASKVGSWPFLIGQTAVLTGWIGANLMPGVPHWDESPFILLNLMFSFASAYTAPIVLMSQNRQTDEDRESAAENYRVNLATAAQLELLQEKIDALYALKLEELIELKQQNQPEEKVAIAVQNSEFQAQNISLVASSVSPRMLPIPSIQPLYFVNVSEQQSFQSRLSLDNIKIIN